MIFKKNNRGGFTLDNANTLCLSKENIWLENEVDHCDFKNFKYQLNCGKRKLKTIIAVLKWLFNKEKVINNSINMNWSYGNTYCSGKLKNGKIKYDN